MLRELLVPIGERFEARRCYLDAPVRVCFRLLGDRRKCAEKKESDAVCLHDRSFISHLNIGAEVESVIKANPGLAAVMQPDASLMQSC